MFGYDLKGGMQQKRTKSGRVYVVRYRTNGRNNYRQFVAKEDAQAFERSIYLRRANGGVPPSDPRMTVCDLVALYADSLALDVVSGERAENTAKAHATQLENHVLPQLGGVKLAQLTPAIVAGWRDALKADGVGLPTIRRSMAVLSAVCSFGAERGLLPSNPVRDVKGVRAPRKAEPVVLGPDELDRLVEALSTERDKMLVRLLAFTGMRPSEALALRWSDVGDHTVRVSKALALGKEKETKTRRDRSVPLSPELVGALEAWRTEQRYPVPAALLFPRKDGQPWTDTDYRNWRRRSFSRAAERAGIEITRPYDLRHMAISRWIAEGRDVVTVAGWAGHAPSMTTDVYGHQLAEASAARQA